MIHPAAIRAPRRGFCFLRSSSHNTSRSWLSPGFWSDEERAGPGRASGESDNYIYGASITVRWKADGRDVERVFNQWGSSSSLARYQSIVRRYKEGSNVEVRYDPSRPSDAYVEAGYTLDFFSFRCSLQRSVWPSRRLVWLSSKNRSLTAGRCDPQSPL